MIVTVSSSTETKHGPVVPFTCHKCQQAVQGEVIETVERGKLYGVIPVTTFRNTFIACPACQKKFGMALPLDRLQALPAETLEGLILRGPPKSAMWLAIAGLLLVLVPVVGMVLSGISLYLGRGNGGWVRALGWLGLIVNLAVTASFALLLIMSLSTH
jgi:hypothetical protein